MPNRSPKDETELRTAIGRRIRSMILARGWNQSTLAREATKFYRVGEITRSNVSNWVKGQSLPGPARAQAVAKALDVEITALRPINTVEALRRPPKAAQHKAIVVGDNGDGTARVHVDSLLPWATALRILEAINSGGGSGPDNRPSGDGAERKLTHGAEMAGRRATKAVVHAPKRTR